MEDMKRRLLGLAAGLLVTSFSPNLLAAEDGDWIVRVGVHNIDPKSNNASVGGAPLSVDSDTQLTFDFTYMLTANWGLEVLAAIPFEHDVTLGGTRVASTKHLPPTISFLYRFGTSRFQPYVGAGVNVTIFSSEKTFGPLAGTDLDLDTSTGAALSVGFDYEINDRMIFNGVIRSIDLDTDAELDGAALTTVAIDPIAIGFNIGWVF